jgi:uncharacterized protein
VFPHERVSEKPRPKRSRKLGGATSAPPSFEWMKRRSEQPPRLTGRGVAAGLPLARVQTDSGKLVCERCEIADSKASKAKGLLGRDGLEPNGGMFIEEEGAIHTFGMRFPIDALFLDSDGKVLRIKSKLRPWRLAGSRNSAAVLELPAGRAAEAGVELGDRLLFDESVSTHELGSASAAVVSRRSRTSYSR